MFKKSIFSICIIFAGVVFAAPYGHYDMKQVVITEKTEEGGIARLNLRYLDQMIDDLAAHAVNYPTSFDSSADEDRAKKDALILSGTLDILMESADANPDLALIKRSSLVNSIGHNLDIPGAAEKAERDYQRFLSHRPNDTSVNFAYGVFLCGSNRCTEAIPYLEVARDGGHTPAYYTLGMAYLAKQDTQTALSYFEEYNRLAPGDETILKMIDMIKKGEIRFVRE